MKAQDQELAALHDEMRAQGPVAACGPCPEVETIQAAVAGTLSPQAQRDLALHCAMCPACFEDWSVAKGLNDALSEDTSKQRKAGTSPGRRRRIQVASSLGVLALAACATLVFWPKNAVHSPEPSLGSQTQLRGRPAPVSKATIRAWFDEDQFRWTLGVPARSFELVIFDTQLKTLARRTGLQSQSLALDEALRRALGNNSRFYWQVVAKGRDGELYRSSPQLQDLNVQRQ